MGDKDPWELTEQGEAEAQKIVELRDRILRQLDPKQAKRLSLEKKLRQKYDANSNNKKHVRNGRYDLIPKEARRAMFTSPEELEKAFYDNYKPRAVRDDESRVKSTQSNDANDNFYDDSDAVTDQRTVTSNTTENVQPVAYQQTATPQWPNTAMPMYQGFAQFPFSFPSPYPMQPPVPQAWPLPLDPATWGLMQQQQQQWGYLQQPQWGWGSQQQQQQQQPKEDAKKDTIE